ncbi:MAG TPA: hypothetical protein ENF96_01880 [Archaeoglobus veneficus]|nr:hypothetical protein [Archaeoglobus veneficus]
MFSICREVKFADIFSLFNLLAGFFGLYTGNLSFVFLAAIFDGVDGIVAESRFGGKFGKELDSLADLVSFGILPAFFIAAYSPAIACFYAVASALRLARFNVLKFDYFVGLPVTASALLVSPAILLGFESKLICALALISAVLMISDIRYTRVRDYRLLAVGAAAIAASFFIPDAAYAVFLAVMLYIFSPLWRREYGWRS